MLVLFGKVYPIDRIWIVETFRAKDVYNQGIADFDQDEVSIQSFCFDECDRNKRLDKEWKLMFNFMWICFGWETSTFFCSMFSCASTREQKSHILT